MFNNSREQVSFLQFKILSNNYFDIFYYYRWSVIVLQEIMEPKALQMICDELNAPTIQRIEDRKGNSCNWNFCMLESNLGYLYDKANTSNEIANYCALN